jgi:hypothetical protein
MEIDFGQNALTFGLAYLFLKFLLPVVIGIVLILAGVAALRRLFDKWGKEMPNENIIYAIAFAALILILLLT